MTSIRGRTALLVALSMTVLLAMGGITLLVVLRRAITVQFDEALVAKAAALRSLTKFDGVNVEVDFAGEAMPRFAGRTASSAPVPTNSPRTVTTTYDDTEYFVVWARDPAHWRVLEQSESLGNDHWPTETITGGPLGLEEGLVALERDGMVVRNAQLPWGGQGRIVYLQFEAAREGDAASAGAPAPVVRLLVAVSRGTLDRTLSTVTWCIAGVGAVMMLTCIAASWWAVSRGLVSLREMSSRVGALGPHTLSTRFDAAGMPQELRPMAEQLGALFSRIEAAFEREKRFSAAASHELRTPIAELTMLLEVASSRARSSEEWSRTAGTALAVLERARSLCETLLRLSRAGASGSTNDPSARTDLARVLAEQTARATPTNAGDSRPVRIQCEVGLIAHVEEGALSSIMGNLIDNALRHGDVTAHAPVVIEAQGGDGRVRIVISNRAPGLMPEDLPRLFEAFWRKDAARQDQRGFGLGLSVAQTLARASGGDIEARLGAPDVLTCQVTLPGAK